jgi:hypothetical protein
MRRAARDQTMALAARRPAGSSSPSTVCPSPRQRLPHRRLPQPGFCRLEAALVRAGSCPSRAPRPQRLGQLSPVLEPVLAGWHRRAEVRGLVSPPWLRRLPPRCRLQTCGSCGLQLILSAELRRDLALPSNVPSEPQDCARVPLIPPNGHRRTPPTRAYSSWCADPHRPSRELRAGRQVVGSRRAPVGMLHALPRGSTVPWHRVSTPRAGSNCGTITR